MIKIRFLSKKPNLPSAHAFQERLFEFWGDEFVGEMNKVSLKLEDSKTQISKRFPSTEMVRQILVKTFP
jgi:hypothetical protein